MKRIVILLVIICLTAGISAAQRLLDIYKKGPVKLVPEMSYGSKNNWESLFNLYYDSITPGVGREWEKKIVVAPDGSVFMSHKNRHEIWKWGPDGNIVKKFGSKGGKQDQFPYMPRVQKIVDNKYVFTSDVQGRLKFFDLDGNFYKAINFDYMTGSFQPIGNGIVMMEGNVLWKRGWRRIIQKLDINSGKTTLVHEYFSNYERTMTIDNVDSLIISARKSFNFRIPGGIGSRDYETLNFLPDGRFIKSVRATGEYTLYDTNGKVTAKSTMGIDPVKITEADVMQNYEMMKKTFQRGIDFYKKLLDPNAPSRKNNPDWKPDNAIRMMNINQKWLDNVDIYMDIKNYNPNFPYFSNIIPDDEGNLLVFEFTNITDKKSNSFNVIAFDNNGQKLARTSFICDGYILSFSESTFVISNGYVYAVARLKNTTGMPLRLVKFKITN